VSERDFETSVMRRSRPTRVGVPEKNNKLYTTPFQLIVY
jgi:hypothetical protein